MNYHYDENLKEVPDDLDSFYEGILQLEREALIETVKIKRGRTLSTLGSLYRIYGDVTKAEINLLNSLDHFDKAENKVEYFVSKLRLAITYQKQKKYEKSFNMFNELKIKCSEDSDLNKYMDFVYQHTGKLYFDMQKYKEALRYFEKAKAMRLKKNDQELINSTDLAIKITLDKLL